MTQWNLYPAFNHLLFPHDCHALYDYQAPFPFMYQHNFGLGVN